MIFIGHFNKKMKNFFPTRRSQSSPKFTFEKNTFLGEKKLEEFIQKNLSFQSQRIVSLQLMLIAMLQEYIFIS